MIRLDVCGIALQVFFIGLAGFQLVPWWAPIAVVLACNRGLIVYYWLTPKTRRAYIQAFNENHSDLH